MTRQPRLRAPLIALLVAMVSGCATHDMARHQAERALAGAGLSPATAQCIARRLADGLTLRQLRKLSALGGQPRSGDGYLAALQRIGDPQVTRVTIAAAAICVAGWDR